MAAQSSDSSAAEPLISGATGTSHPSYPAEEHENLVPSEREDEDESTLASPGLFVWLLTICAGISGLLFGYEYVFPIHISYSNIKSGTAISNTFPLKEKHIHIVHPNHTHQN